MYLKKLKTYQSTLVLEAKYNISSHLVIMPVGNNEHQRIVGIFMHQHPTI